MEMEIAVWIIAPDGIITDEIVGDSETELFFNWQDADDAAKEAGPNAKVFQATTSFCTEDFAPVD
jgi:hypothetical protein